MAHGLWARVGEARLFRVLVFYLAASWLILQVITLLKNELQLPRWLTPVAVALLLIGLVIISATAWIQSHPLTKAKAGELPAAWELDLKGLARSVSRGRLPHPTWARTILGGVVAFSLLFGAAGVYVLLKERGVGASAAEKAMLLVLPFQNLGAAEDEYFADGVTEEIMSRLAGVHGLGVIARTTAIQYKNTPKTIEEIGKDLGVDYVLEGTVRWQRLAEGPSRVRVTPQLIRVVDATHLWSESYDAVLADIFQIQSDVAQRVTKALDIALLEPERRSLEARPTENLEAYDYYLRGNEYFARTYLEQDIRLAIQMYEKAVQLDPAFALAWAKLSEAHSGMYWFHYDRSGERLVTAKAAVDKAFALQPGLPEAHEALGYYYYWGFLDYDRAVEQFAIAHRSQSSNARALAGIGFVRRRQGKFEEALATLEEALKIDPRSAELLVNTAETYVLLRDYAEAERYWERTVSLRPDWTLAYANWARLYLISEGNTGKARAVLDQALRNVGPTQDPDIVYATTLVDLFDGKYQDVVSRLASAALEGFNTQYYFIPKAQIYAQVYTLMGKPQLGLAYYDSARAVVETVLRAQPEDARLHGALGIAYAGLGRKEDAIREAKRGVELLPVSKEAWRGQYRIRDLAQVYVMVGEHDAAIDQLEFLLSVPSEISVPWLRLDPTWAPLRGHPRFQALLEKEKGPAA